MNKRKCRNRGKQAEKCGNSLHGDRQFWFDNECKCRSSESIWSVCQVII